jgi:hypothetical protein
MDALNSSLIMARTLTELLYKRLSGVERARAGGILHMLLRAHDATQQLKTNLHAHDAQQRMLTLVATLRRHALD